MVLPMPNNVKCKLPYASQHVHTNIDFHRDETELDTYIAKYLGVWPNSCNNSRNIDYYKKENYTK